MTDVNLDDLLGEVSTHNPDEVRGEPEVRYRGTPTHRTVVRVTLLTPPAEGRVRRVRHHRRHSPDGFAWGYGGSGPAELARCLLIDALGDAALCPTCLGRRRIVFTDAHNLDAVPAPPGRSHDAQSCYACDSGFGPLVERNYQSFKFAVVGRWPMDESFEISRSEILQWLQEHSGARSEP